MCNLKQGDCIYEKDLATGKTKSDCWCILKELEEKRVKQAADESES